MKRRTASEDGEKSAPSRAEIETLCILHAIGPRGCYAMNLAELLGLSPELALAVADGVEPLVASGWVDVDVQGERFSLTDAGRDLLKTRLSYLLARAT